ncbi:patatin [Calothrix sp. NIES-4071]|nr:patatin [Calothrix sp. NIES-4071]BAZ54796.1 patatin [Calothrix sp. NIES-4105]
MSTIKILSIDGGGIRGIIPAIILSTIEEKTGKPIAELFDVIAGTSTGGLLALGLTKPLPDGTPQYSAKKFIELYEQEGKNIFFNPEKTPSSSKPKYPYTGIEEVLGRYFEETRLSEALQEVLITSYDVAKSSPYFFKRHKAQAKPNLHDFPFSKVARATSAVPGYFEPLKLVVNDPAFPDRVLIDGGVFAANPAMCAYVEAKTLYPDATDFLLVSIGTGELVHKLYYEQIKDWGTNQWSQSLLDVIFNGIADTVDYQLQKLLPSTFCQKHYYRFQTDNLEPGSIIDDPSYTNIQSLKSLAQTIIETQNKDLEQLCQQLVSSQVKI